MSGHLTHRWKIPGWIPLAIWQQDHVSLQFLQSTHHKKQNICQDIHLNDSWFMCQCVFIEIWSMQEVWRARKIHNSCSRCSQEQLYLLDCSLNFPSALYPNECTADVWTNCFITKNRKHWSCLAIHHLSPLSHPSNSQEKAQ